MREEGTRAMQSRRSNWMNTTAMAAGLLLCAGVARAADDAPTPESILLREAADAVALRAGAGLTRQVSQLANQVEELRKKVENR